MSAPRIIATAGLALGLLAWPVSAQQSEQPGPPHETNIVVGQAPPTAFVLQSIDGESYDLSTALGEQPLLLLFFRGTW